MAVVIRLQGLRDTAGSEEIRNFFSGLKIPDGGVHIIGGVQEEAFIIFASDEDARRAMVRSGGCIRGSPINLLLSSKSEMQSILEESTKNPELELKWSLRESSRGREVDVSGGARRADHIQTNRGGRQSGHSHDEARQNLRAPSTSDDDLYLILKGMPFSVTEKDVRDFFHGLLVKDIILKTNSHGQNNGEGLVQFATSQDARDGLMRDREYIGTRYVNVHLTHQQKWLEAGGKLAVGVNGNGKFRRGRSPTHSPRYPQARTRSRSPLGLPTHSPRYPQARTRSRSPLALPTHSPRYSQPQARTRSRSPLAPPTRTPRYSQAHTRSRSPLAYSPNSPSNQDFCVILKNLSYGVGKHDIKGFFTHAKLEDDQILFLLNNEGRTRSLFVLFNSLGEYRVALTRNNDKLYNRSVTISPISRKKMMSILESHTGRPGSFQERPLDQQSNPYDSKKVCLYVRNMPCDVHKVEIMDFFFGFTITEDRVFLLRDHRGAGLGEALVVFRSEGEAMSAQSLNGQRFLGTEVMLKCISLSQMREFGVEPPAAQESMPREERYSSRKSEGPHYAGDMEVANLRMPTDGNQAMSNLEVNVHTEVVGMQTACMEYNGERGNEKMSYTKSSSAQEACDLCGERGHAAQMYRCKTFRDATVTDRRNHAKKEKACFKCLDLHEGACRSNKNYLCKKEECKRGDNPSDHHYFLCLKASSKRDTVPRDTARGSTTREPWGTTATDGGNGFVHGDFGPPAPQLDGPTRVKLENLPFRIEMDEIYDFCYGYHVIPRSVALPHRGTATVVFESREEALTAVKELSGRPIGARKIQLMMMPYIFD